MDMPVGRVGESQIPFTDASGVDPEEIARVLMVMIQQERSKANEAAIAQKIRVDPRKVELALNFWKPRYFDVRIDGRHLNGIEAYHLGDPSKTPAAKVNKVPYIAMCNLMALEALRMMGENIPTSTEAVLLAYATEREKEIADFWKKTFAPTVYQTEWAWKTALAIMAGDPYAHHDVLDNFRVQLPD